MIHRDIKPENLLVGDQNEILLSDFGIAVVTASARAADSALDAGSWNPAGTVSYMAPQQIQGKTVPASDQYALAIVVYEWLTGVLPFSGVSDASKPSPMPWNKPRRSIFHLLCLLQLHRMLQVCRDQHILRRYPRWK